MPGRLGHGVAALACFFNVKCASGAGVDGVCCGTGCTGAWEACSAAKTGGPKGLCLAVPAGTDPDNECSTQAASTCGTTGGQLDAQGTTCAAARCTGTLLNLAQACAPHACTGTACVTHCTDSSPCAAPNICDLSGRCVPPSCTDGIKSAWETDVDCGGGLCPPCANGKLCAVNADCASGRCAGGVCSP